MPFVLPRGTHSVDLGSVGSDAILTTEAEPSRQTTGEEGRGQSLQPQNLDLDRWGERETPTVEFGQRVLGAAP